MTFRIYQIAIGQGLGDRDSDRVFVAAQRDLGRVAVRSADDQRLFFQDG